MCCSRQHCLCPGHIAVLFRRLQCQVISIGTYWVYKVLRNEGELTYSLAVCTPFLLVLIRVWKCPFCLKLMLKKIVMMSLPLLYSCSLSWNLALLPIQGKECISLSVHTECHPQKMEVNNLNGKVMSKVWNSLALVASAKQVSEYY